MRKLLVIGTRPGSLGSNVFEMALRNGWDVTAADINPAFGLALDMNSPEDQFEFWRKAPNYTSVVCCAGVNLESSIYDEDWRRPMAEQMAANFTGHIETLRYWLANRVGTFGSHWVSIASNSAHIPRSRSAWYCASKAALVMGMRCVARELAGVPTAPAIYTYSPGWLAGTPMSREVQERLLANQSPHRIPSGQAIKPYELARVIVANLGIRDKSFNGTDIRIDGGEI